MVIVDSGEIIESEDNSIPGKRVGRICNQSFYPQSLREMIVRTLAPVTHLPGCVLSSAEFRGDVPNLLVES